jgi:chromosome segregation ATPase
LFNAAACFQFVIVSLKDGMFHNANVLYKTRLIDGVSTVTRATQGKGPNKENVQQGQP